MLFADLAAVLVVRGRRWRILEGPSRRAVLLFVLSVVSGISVISTRRR
jgi:hypothetical protein